MNQNKNIFEKVTKDINPLNICSKTVYSQLIIEYFSYYGFQYDNVEHVFGTFKFRDYSLAAHIFLPSTYNSAVLLMHGYLDHTGLLSSTIKHLLSKGYLVAAYDMPGHGVSSGEPSGIDSFPTYTNIMEEFIGILKKNFNIPINIIGHSTGGAVTIDYMLSRDSAEIEKVVLIAPLVHSYLWNVSVYSYPFLSGFAKRVPRVFRISSSDKEFVRFNRLDPLQQWTVPLGWLKALTDWNKSIYRYNPNEKKMLVLQGMNDTVVDWKYNMKLIKNKFPNSEIMYFKSGNHHLLNEAAEIRSEVFKVIDTKGLAI